MTRADELFNREMEFARYMQRSDMDVYWKGYAAGVMRARFGPVAVGDRDHETWTSAGASGTVARGYRDGYSKLAAPVVSGLTTIAGPR